MDVITGTVARVEVTVRVGDRVRIVQHDPDSVTVTWEGPVAEIDYHVAEDLRDTDEMVVTLTNDERLYLTADGEDTIEVLSPAESGS